MLLSCPNMCGKTVLKDGAACTAGKATLPIASSSVKPKVFFTLWTLTCKRGKRDSAATAYTYCSCPCSPLSSPP